MKEQRELPNPIYVPLPVWKETKERIRMQMDATRQTFHDRSREWEQKEQVMVQLLLFVGTAGVSHVTPCERWRCLFARSYVDPLHLFTPSRAVQVLGHQVRSNIHRPREQLAMPSQAELEFDAEAAAAAGDDEGECLLLVWLSMLALQSLRIIMPFRYCITLNRLSW